MKRLEHCYGLTSFVLSWLQSYLAGRTQYVNFNGPSKVTLVMFGVPQGSVLGPLLFILYTAEIGAIIENFGFKVHGYADDLQIYDHATWQEAGDLIRRLSACVDAVKTWMSTNRLCLNPCKTEVIWLGSKQRIQHCPMDPISISGAWIVPSTRVRDLGVILDSELTMIPHVNALTRLCYFNIRQIRTIRRSLDMESTCALMRALIHSRLDYCNGVLACLPDYIYSRLQMVLKSAARLILKKPSRATVSNEMITILHWLPYPQRVTYKAAIVIYKCRHGLAPVYLSNRFIQVSEIAGRSMLRSASNGLLVVPYTKTKTIGPRGYYYSGPIAWNSLPRYLRDDSMSLATFKKCLKTYLFKGR